jgi:LysR family transcriptional regulator, mexEF-oprN operon transcriptional activator
MNNKLIDTAQLQQLRVLAAVVSEGSVALAAKRLHVTQPAISNALAKLRQSTGDPLIIKTGHKIVPTSRAVQIVQVVTPALSAIQSVVTTNTHFSPDKAQGQIRLGMPDYLESILAPAICQRLRAVAPKLQLIMRPCNAQTVSAQLDSGDIDFGLTLAPPLPHWQLATVLFEERFVCLMPAQLAKPKRKFTLAEFVALPQAMVSFQGDVAGQIDLALQALGQQRKVVATATTFSSLGELLSRSELIACVPSPIAPRLAKAFRLKISPVPFAIAPIPISLCESRARIGDGMLAWMKQQLADCIHHTSEFHADTPRS